MRMVEFLARDLDLLFPQKNCLIIHMSALTSTYTMVCCYGTAMISCPFPLIVQQIEVLCVLLCSAELHVDDD